MRTSRVVALLALPALLAACPESDRVGDGILKPIDADVSVDTSRPDVQQQRGATGDPCAVGAECESGLCTPAAAGGVCTEPCTDACPAGFVCAPADAAASANVCWRLDAVACQPCSADEQCQLGGQTGNKCVSYGAAGSFCGLACAGADACPDGYACSDDGQCVRDGGQCECNAAGILAAAATACELENDNGSCAGMRQCTSGGLSRCDAPTPAPETCDGRDQNCDGQTDEGTDGQDCTLTNEFGTCIGAVQCSDGRPLCVGRAPAAEICNGVDDDCDGDTDEDQPDLDLDLLADCVDDDIDGDGSLNEDDCAQRNPAIYPGQTEVCNGIDDNCNHQVDEGTHGTLADECGAYICAGVPGCRSDCSKDAHCIPGHLCDLDDGDDDGDAAECLPSVCGNGEVEIREACDDGLNDGAYGGCMPGCGGLAPRCGDGIRQPAHEACDSGALNGTPNHCNGTCTGPTPPFCGNGVAEAGEGCDLGAGNSNQPNAECRLDCSPRRCGDGVVDDGAEEACDAGETANGQTLCGCQLGCQWAPAAVTCRPVDGACDVAERCTGSGSCAVNAFLTDVICNPSTGGCDPAEVCSGASADCPGDLLDDNGTVCRDSTGGCDPAETCDGESAACPGDAISPPQTVCRQPDGDCDIAELCDGESAACPDDEYYGSTVICRGASGLCDAAERCPGDSAECPVDGVLPAQSTCREAVGTCDVAELCSGGSKVCPDDVVVDAETVCHPSQGACDVVETCDGVSGLCPDDAVAGAGVVCRDGDGTCDPEEACDGATAACPDDAVAADETPCPQGEGTCGFEPCWCVAGQCDQLCGDGVLQGSPDGGPTEPPVASAPLLASEACDDGDGNGARDGCSLMCDGRCDADFGWVIPAGGVDSEGGHGVTVDEAGGTVAAGEFRAYPYFLDAPTLPGAPQVAPFGAAVFGDEWFYSRDGSDDFWVMAQDTDGNPRWAACGGGFYDDAANGVDQDDLGDVYVTGRFGGQADIDCCELNTSVASVTVLPGGGCEHSLEAVGSYTDYQDVFLAKWSKDGAIQWAVSGGSYDDDSGEDVATDSVGRSVVVGYHSGDSFSGATFGDHVVYGTGYRDILVVKYDKNGNAMWAHGGLGGGEDVAQGVALDGAGNVYVTGFFEGDGIWDDNQTTFDSGPVEGATLFVLGLDAEGDNPWVLTAYTSNGYGNVEGTDVAVDGAGNVYVTGYFEGGGAYFGDIEVATGGNGADLFVAKISGGAWQWVAVASDEDQSFPGEEVGWGVAVDRSGKVYVTGEFNSHIQFGPFGLDSGCGFSCFPQAPGLPPQAGYFYGGDGFVAKLDPAGEWLWAKQFGGDGAGPTSSRDIGVDPRGRIYTTGGFTGPATFDAIDLEGFGFGQFPTAPSFDYGQDAFVGKLIPDGGPRCFDCGDGVVDVGEGCDDDDGLDHCAGACDGICFGPANSCGDGWDECEEQYDLGPDLDPPDLGMCLLPAGNLWCFQTDANTFTYEPVEPGVAAALGPGVQAEQPLTGLGGNPTQHPDCPLCNPLDANVDCRSGSGRQWGGDGPPLVVGSSARSICDGDPSTPPCHSLSLGCSDTATNDEAAAVECGDFYEFVANTGDEAAFEFDELTRTDGPTKWSLWVSLTGGDSGWERVAGGPTTRAASSDFGAGRPTPMHVVVLTDARTAQGPVRNQLGVRFRLYAWGATAPGAPWTVDNVRVGEPTFGVDHSGLVSHWTGDFTAADAVGANDGAWTGAETYTEDSVRCGAFWFDDNASHYVDVGADASLQVANVTASAWFRRDDNATVSGIQVIAAQMTPAGVPSYGLVLANGAIAFGVWPDGQAATDRNIAGPVIADTEWHHAVGTYDGARLVIYLDGSPVNALDYAGGNLQPLASEFGIGASSDGFPFSGAVDEVQVYGRALDQTSVSALYFSQRARTTCAPPEPPGEVIIDTTTTWNGFYTVGNLCSSGAYGQTFTLDAPTTVDGFSLFLVGGETPLRFRGQISAWDPVDGVAYGPVLYTSTERTTSESLRQHVFATGGLELPPGTYVAVANSGGIGNTPGAWAELGHNPDDDADPGGGWVDSQCTDSADPAGYPWYIDYGDLAFFLYGTEVAPPTEAVVIISEIVDGDLTGGLPKFFELTNVGGTAADLSLYQVGRYSNGAATVSAVVALSGMLDPGASYVIASEATTFTTVYGFAPDLVNGAANNNGDDGVVLLDAAGGVVDTYGVAGTSGVGQVWEYTDGYAHRNPGFYAPRASFEPSEWTFGGKASLDAADDATRTQLLRDNTTPGAF